MEKLWWQLYARTFMKKYTDEKLAALSNTEIEDLTMNDPLHVQLSTLAEYAWLQNNKRTFFVDDGVSDFITSVQSSHSLSEGLPPIHTVFAISWHPKDNLPPCLLYAHKEDNIVAIHWKTKEHHAFWLRYDYKYDGLTGELETRIKNHIHGLCTYMTAFPDLIRPGLPANMKERNIRFFANSSSFFVNLHEKVKATYRYFNGDRAKARAHFRQDHWRVLHSDYFKHNPDGSPRIIWIPATIVNSKNMDTHTVEID